MFSKVQDDNLSQRVWFTTEQVAEYLSISTRTVYEYVRNKYIPFHKIPHGSKLVFNWQEIDEWTMNGEKDEEARTQTAIEIANSIWDQIKR